MVEFEDCVPWPGPPFPADWIILSMVDMTCPLPRSSYDYCELSFIQPGAASFKHPHETFCEASRTDPLLQMETLRLSELKCLWWSLGLFTNGAALLWDTRGHFLTHLMTGVTTGLGLGLGQ